MEIDKNLFIDRYKKFWRKFHPGAPYPANLLAVTLDYYEDICKAHIEYETFSRICGEVEHDFTELPYGWNQAAYVIDAVRSERLESAQNQAQADSQPITLCKTGTPITESKNPKLQSLIASIKTNNPTLYEIISRIKVRPTQKPHNFCEACQNSGVIDVIEYGARRARRCSCPKGQALTKQMREASHEDCRQSALKFAEYEA